ncbi:hypothetical protein PPACK8108_LOCUS8422 [Phakopsora pachyrhizi]|uniref:Uncharacterized protein n=1 Tax=Phakopsora pachyrhizi TaxID=170000 RepID=A0AAV0AUN3_PHAPC|nr:hypothetical protein PPACK8108_LOCUS8422 [Phakopsora pachyrhizi]
MSTRSNNPDMLPGIEPTRCSNGRRGSNRLQSEPEDSRPNEELEVQEDREGITYPPRQFPENPQEEEVDIVMENKDKDQKIRDLVKEHIAHYNLFQNNLKEKKMMEAKADMKAAMKTQQTLQKLRVSSKEIPEAYPAVNSEDQKK